MEQIKSFHSSKEFDEYIKEYKTESGKTNLTEVKRPKVKIFKKDDKDNG